MKFILLKFIIVKVYILRQKINLKVSFVLFSFLLKFNLKTKVIICCFKYTEGRSHIGIFKIKNEKELYIYCNKKNYKWIN